MITVLNKQHVKKRRVTPKSPRNSKILWKKEESGRVPINKKPLSNSANQTVTRNVSIGRFLTPSITLVAIVSVLLILIIVYNSRFNRVYQSALLPAENSVESILMQSLIPESERSVGTRKSLPKEVVASLKISKYRVKRGDTLSAIAGRYHINLGTLISFNDIKDARLLKEGQLLEIPNKDGLKYKVRRGDSLSRISKLYGIRLEAILDWNNLRSSVIQPGQELFIPGAKMRLNDLNRVLGKLFIYPTRGRITSRFGMRHDPFTGIMRFHNGLDLANRVGTRIVAAMAGTVVRTGVNPTYGRYIIIRHPDGFQTLYAHLSRILVRRGQRVNQNQLIGKMGNTGYSTGSHLHFSIFKNGEPVDPLRYLH